VDFAAWSLTVSGAVQKPGDYRLAQIQSLPKIAQNTRHVCVEGWDVIGKFGGARLSDFLKSVGRGLERAISDSGYARTTITNDRYGDSAAPTDAAVLRNV